MHQDISIDRAKQLLKEGWTPIVTNCAIYAEYQMTLYKEGIKDTEGRYMTYTAHFPYYSLEHCCKEMSTLMVEMWGIQAQMSELLIKYLKLSP